MSQNIDINLKTTADTTGAKAVEVSLEEVKKNAEEIRQSEADNRRQAEQEAQAADQAEQTRQINRKATALVLQQAGQAAAQAANGIREFADELKEVDPDTARNIEAVAKGLDLVNLSAQGAALGASVGGPFGAAFGAVVLPAVSATINEIQQAMIAQGSLDKMIGETPIIANRLREVKGLMDMRAEAESWDALTTKMKGAAESAKFAAEILASRYKGEEAIARANVSIARSTGGDVEGAEKVLVQVQNMADSTQRANNLRLAIGTAEIAEQELETAKARIHRLQQQSVIASAKNAAELKKEIEGIESQLDPLKERLYKAVTEVARLQIVNPLEERTIDRQNAARDLEAGQQGTVGAIQGLISNVEAKGGGGAELKKAIEDLKRAVSDSVLDGNDLSKVPVIMAQYRDQILRLGVSFEVIDLVNKNMDDLIGKMQQQRSFADDLSNRIKRLEESRK